MLLKWARQLGQSVYSKEIRPEGDFVMCFCTNVHKSVIDGLWNCCEKVTAAGYFAEIGLLKWQKSVRLCLHYKGKGYKGK